MFDNEQTFLKMQKEGKEEEFHKLYEQAVEDVKKYFGKEYPNIIAGEVVESKKIKDISPTDGKEIATFQLSSVETTEKAIEVLHNNYKSWYSLGYAKRAHIILNAADKLSEEKFKFSALLAYENGKNRYEAMADVDEGIDFMRYYALNMIENEGFDRLSGKGYPNEESRSVMKPYGVFAVIAPFNFFAITVGMTVGPLVVGNASILKPSSDIPLSSHLFIRLLHESGVPKEVVAYLSGSGSVVGKMLVEHPKIAGVVFTGSRDVGMQIFRKATEFRPKPVITEMGGKDAIIVSDKADIDKAVEGVARAAFGFSGQKCSACSILYVHEKVYDEFMPKLVERTGKITLGDPSKRETFMGPVVNKDAFEKYKSLVPTFEKEGKVMAGGKAQDREGYYVEPTIVADVNRDAYIAKNELFLPVLAVVKATSVEDAVNDINRSEYGLTGGIFTEDRDEIDYYFSSADVGVIYANRERGGSTGAIVGSNPFVGWKMSGSTGKGTGSYYYLQQFLREQSQTIAH
ncbi:aldehyde dehydrogenase [uncultured archaeon]|nr:aldehyde dehydrogenase [uncultured archaeon]